MALGAAGLPRITIEEGANGVRWRSALRVLRLPAHLLSESLALPLERTYVRYMSYTAAPTPSPHRPLRSDRRHADGRYADGRHADGARARGSHPDVVREIGGHYDSTAPDVPPALARLLDVPMPDDPSDPALTDPDRDAHPFGLPVLSEVPQLAMLLQDLRKVDRLLSDVVDAIMLLEETGLAEATTGIGVNTWLSIVGRRTGADTRMLRTTAAVMRRIPTLHGAFRTGAVSWAQVRSVVLAVRPLPSHLDARMDAAVGDALAGAGEAEPDALTRTIRWHLDAIDPTEVERGEKEAERAEYLAMQPRMDGTGGRIWGDLGPVNFALLDAAVNTGPSGEQIDDAGAAGANPTSGSAAPTPVAAAGRARLHRLMDHLERSLNLTSAPDRAGKPTTSSSTSGGPSPSASPRSSSGPMGSRMQLLLRADLATLLDRDQTPPWLLTTVLGGHVRVSAETARRLIDERGADLRTVILDDTGSVVGVGRRARIATDWLKDATLALHETCTTPGCDVAARHSETDHAQPWHPTRPQDSPGRTDVDQLGPGCSRHNLTKERDGWVVTQRADGTRRWHHPRSGLTTTTRPVRVTPPPRGDTATDPPEP